MAQSNHRKSTKTVVKEVCHILLDAESKATATLDANDVSVEVLVELTALLAARLYADVYQTSADPVFRRYCLAVGRRVAPIVFAVLSSDRPDEAWRRSVDPESKGPRTRATRATS